MHIYSNELLFINNFYQGIKTYFQVETECRLKNETSSENAVLVLFLWHFIIQYSYGTKNDLENIKNNTIVIITFIISSGSSSSARSTITIMVITHDCPGRANGQLLPFPWTLGFGAYFTKFTYHLSLKQ